LVRHIRTFYAAPTALNFEGGGMTTNMSCLTALKIAKQLRYLVVRVDIALWCLCRQVPRQTLAAGQGSKLCWFRNSAGQGG